MDACNIEARISPWMRRLEAASLRGLGRWSAAVVGVLALGMAATLAVRRLAGGFTAELAGGELLLLTLLTVGTLGGLRKVRLRLAMTASQRRREIAAQIIPTAAAVLIALAVTSPESPLWAVVLLWTALSVEETWFWSGSMLRARTEAPGSSGSAEAGDAGVGEVFRTTASRAAYAVDRNTTPTPDDEEPEECEFPPEHLQQLTRYRDEAGAEVIHGRLRAEFAAGQRVHHLHVAFCPPLAAAPEFAVEQLDGPDAALTAGQVETYGARIDVRLSQPAEARDTIVTEFYARAER
jgi:hypothetical protein